MKQPFDKQYDLNFKWICCLLIDKTERVTVTSQYFMMAGKQLRDQTFGQILVIKGQKAEISAISFRGLEHLVLVII